MLRDRVAEARALVQQARIGTLWIRTGPDLDDEEPTPLQRQVWTTYAELEHAITFALPEGDAWYQSAECAELGTILDELERLFAGNAT